ncbi:hypothetical protein NDU88_001922 [Pleurodeles waltl]|uniref:Uncharacterized protein n=1 Tax=Pleurodeles waltl TaxID=8319 RepID=A0AAV7W0X5_PLEWA|nr:hypothetical protein NDU88_001922 [Pleurodeles waltl]
MSFMLVNSVVNDAALEVILVEGKFLGNGIADAFGDDTHIIGDGLIDEGDAAINYFVVDTEVVVVVADVTVVSAFGDDILTIEAVIGAVPFINGAVDGLAFLMTVP